jgi:glycerol-3-phosphate dehydrogenase subunit C
MGPKAAQMLRLIPDAKVGVVERCSGHGGSWGVMKENFEVALKVGRPVARQANESGAKYVVSECPLARDHIAQGVEKLRANADPEEAAKHAELVQVQHPIELMAIAYGIGK